MDFVQLGLHIALTGLAASYVVKALRLEAKSSHWGPFKSRGRIVVFLDGEGYPIHIQAVTLFDWIRRPFGVYSIKCGDNAVEWVVSEDRAEYFTCPFCLSWWVSAILFTLLNGLNWPGVGYWIVGVFASSAVAFWAYEVCHAD